jgi:hypothetical protein
MKKKFVWIGAFLTFSLIVVLLAYSATGTTRAAAARLTELKQEARKLGVPTSMDEVPADSTDEANNAAPLIHQAMERVTTDKKAAADLLVEAAKRPSCTFEWEVVVDNSIWGIVKMDILLIALFETAEQDLKAGNNAAFQRRARAAVNVARKLADTPTAGAFLRSVEAERAVYTWLGRTMIGHPADPFVMSVVQQQAFEQRPIPSLLLALRHFFAQGNNVAQNREIDGDQRITWIWSKGEFPTDPWGRDAVEATHLENAIALYEAVRAAETWPEAMEKLESTVDIWTGDRRPLYYTLRESGHIRDLARKAAENEAARRILFLAAGMFKHRIQYQQFPADSPIKGVMELDPFTNKPSKLSNLGTGFVVYSVGSDRFDSSGPVDEGLTFAEDIGFRLKAWPSP